MWITCKCLVLKAGECDSIVMPRQDNRYWFRGGDLKNDRKKAIGPCYQEKYGASLFLLRLHAGEHQVYLIVHGVAFFFSHVSIQE